MAVIVHRLLISVLAMLLAACGSGNQTYDAIKAASPATRVGPIFRYEHLSGTGALNNWTSSHWPAMELHDLERVDVVGLSSSIASAISRW